MESAKPKQLRWHSQSKARLIAIADRSGVNACKILKLSFIGVLGILIRMREGPGLERRGAEETRNS